MQSKEIFPEYWIEDIVVQKLRPDIKGMVTGIFIRPDNVYLYYISWENGSNENHYSIELQAAPY